MAPESSSKNPTTVKLKLAGAFSGILEVDVVNWTILMLREEVGKRSDCEPKLINLICAGKVLKDGEGKEKLCDYGIRHNSKILVTKVPADAVSEEERSLLLQRIKTAAAALAGRHAEGSLPVEDFNIELENQSGQKVHLGSETARQGVMMGLMLHAKAKRFIRKKMYKEALDVLAMGEEAFSLCDPKILEMVDNIPILQIDTVWCYFMLRDIKWLSLASVRLAKAREGIERCHGEDFNRVRMLQEGCYPELPLHLRLELLEGVVAYHSEQFDKCKKALTSAQAKYLQLQVSDEALSMLMGMGYKEKEAKRALRMNKQDVERAVEFIVEEKEKKAQRAEENRQRQKEIMEQKRYGLTPLKKAVDIQRLGELVSMEFEKSLAAEALRRNENDTQRALDDLTNPETNSMIQSYIDSRKLKRPRQTNDTERSEAVAAVRALGSLDGALNLFTPQIADNGSVASADPSQSSSEIAGNSDIPNDVEDPSVFSDNSVEPRDVEMEDTIASELTGEAILDYDIEVTQEGEAITEYLALLASSTGA